MSGFLHKLAAHAINSGHSALHSAARLPYAIAPAAPSQDSAILAAMASTRLSAADSAHIPAQNQPDNSLQAELDGYNHKNPIMPSAPEALIAQSASRFSTQPDPDHAHSPSVKSGLRQAEKTATGEAPVRAEVIQAHSTMHNAPTTTIATANPDSTFIDNAPALLLPLQNAPAHPVLHSGTDAQRGAGNASKWQYQVEETTEVHVNIGRIEVTAVHEAPAPKRPAATMAKPMTLDEYLARRQRQT